MFAKEGRTFAAKCIKALLDKKCDPLLLFWLRNEEILSKVEFGAHMLEFMRSQGWSRENLEDPEYRQAFFQTIRDYHAANGIS